MGHTSGGTHQFDAHQSGHTLVEAHTSWGHTPVWHTPVRAHSCLAHIHQLGAHTSWGHTSWGHAPVGGTHQLGAEFCIPKMSQAVGTTCKLTSLLTGLSLPTGFPLTTNRVPLHYQQGSPSLPTGFPFTTNRALSTNRVPPHYQQGSPSLQTGFPLITNRVPPHYQQGSPSLPTGLSTNRVPSHYNRAPTHYQQGSLSLPAGLPVTTSRALTASRAPTHYQQGSHCQQGSHYQQGIQHYSRSPQTWLTCHSCRPQDGKALRFLWLVVLALMGLCCLTGCKTPTYLLVNGSVCEIKPQHVPLLGCGAATGSLYGMDRAAPVGCIVRCCSQLQCRPAVIVDLHYCGPCVAHTFSQAAL